MQKAYPLQQNAAVLITVITLNLIDRKKMKKFALIGKNISYTLSPEIHAEFGLDYRALEIEDESALANVLSSGGYDGFNVTIPYKQAVMPLLDEIEDTARKIGAVNTVIKKAGRLIGCNTDFFGMSAALRRAGISLRGKHVLILGTGGAALTACALSLEEGAASAFKVSRSGSLNYQNCYDLKDTEIIINATPCGTAADWDNAPIAPARFPKLTAVFDAVYNPIKTRLLYEAEKIGVKVENGLFMLVAQAKAARDLFTASAAPEELTESVLKKLISRLSNIVLVGMPSSGKSETARIIAGLSGRELVDTDAEIERREGKIISQIFGENGEEYFRKLESEVVEAASGGFKKVIATGGGAVLSEKNRRALKRNSKVYFIERELDVLSTEGRPLSKDLETLKKMYAERRTLYLDCCDAVVYNIGTVQKLAKEIIKLHEESFSD